MTSQIQLKKLYFIHDYINIKTPDFGCYEMNSSPLFAKQKGGGVLGVNPRLYKFRFYASILMVLSYPNFPKMLLVNIWILERWKIHS